MAYTAPNPITFDINDATYSAVNPITVDFTLVNSTIAVSWTAVTETLIHVGITGSIPITAMTTVATAVHLVAISPITSISVTPQATTRVNAPIVFNTYSGYVPDAGDSVIFNEVQSTGDILFVRERPPGIAATEPMTVLVGSTTAIVEPAISGDTQSKSLGSIAFVSEPAIAGDSTCRSSGSIASVTAQASVTGVTQVQLKFGYELEIPVVSSGYEISENTSFTADIRIAAPIAEYALAAADYIAVEAPSPRVEYSGAAGQTGQYSASTPAVTVSYEGVGVVYGGYEVVTPSCVATYTGTSSAQIDVTVPVVEVSYGESTSGEYAVRIPILEVTSDISGGLEVLTTIAQPEVRYTLDAGGFGYSATVTAPDTQYELTHGSKDGYTVTTPNISLDYVFGYGDSTIEVEIPTFLVRYRASRMRYGDMSFIIPPPSSVLTDSAGIVDVDMPVLNFRNYIQETHASVRFT